MSDARELCEEFLNHKIGLVELQERLDTLIVSETQNELFWKLHNQLEEFRFTKLESNFYAHAEEIVRDFLQNLQNQESS